MKIKKIAALALTCVMAFSSFTGCGKDPKETVKASIENLAAAPSAVALFKELGITGFAENMAKKPFKVGCELTLEDADVYGDLAEYESSTVYAELSYNEDDAKTLLDMGVGYGGSKLLSGQLYLDEKQVAVAVPELLDKVFYVEYDNLLENFKKSALATEIGLTESDWAETEEFFEGLMDGMTTDAAMAEVTEFILGFSKDIEKFKDKIEVSAIDAEKFEINGKDCKCDGYEIVITKKSVKNLIESAIEYYFLDKDAIDFYEKIAEEIESLGVDADFDELYDMIDQIEYGKDEMFDFIDEYLSDINIEMYIYKGEIVSFSAETKINDPETLGKTSFKVGIYLECTGGEYSVYDNYQLSVKAMGMNIVKLVKESETGSNDYSAEWKVTTALDDDFQINVSLDIDKKGGDFEVSAAFIEDYNRISILADGALDVDGKKSLEIEFDQIKIKYQDYWDSFSVKLSGKLYAECGVSVSMPKGDKFNVLTKKESDWLELVDDIYDIEDVLDDIFDMFY